MQKAEYIQPRVEYIFLSSEDVCVLSVTAYGGDRSFERDDLLSDASDLEF